MILEFESRKFIIIINNQSELSKMINAGEPFISITPMKILVNSNLRDKIARTKLWPSLFPIYENKIEWI